MDCNDMQIGFITSNPGKLDELRQKLTPLGHNIVQLKIPYLEIQADTLAEVAKVGFKWILERMAAFPENIDKNILTQLNEQDMLILEDSGLFVHSLDNFPGVYSKFVFKTIGYDGILKPLGVIRNAHIFV